MHAAARRAGVAAALLLFAAGCSVGHLVQRPASLDEVQQRYTRLVRWGAYERAGRFVDPELREEFHRIAGALEGLRITDYTVERIEAGGDDTATAFVTYTAYSRASLVELAPIAETQEWYRDRDTREWRVRPGLGALHAAATRRLP